MKPNLVTLATGLILVFGIAQPVLGQTSTSVENVHGIVDGVQPIYSTYVQKTPITETVCHTEELPVYSGRGGDDGGDDELGGLIVGGLIGSAIGNEVSDKDGAGTAGAVVGALLGRQAAIDNKRNQPGAVVGYRQQDVCRDVTRVKEERIQELTGYELDVSVGETSISLKTDARRPYKQGDTIRLNRRTSYSLR